MRPSRKATSLHTFISAEDLAFVLGDFGPSGLLGLSTGLSFWRLGSGIGGPGTLVTLDSLDFRLVPWRELRLLSIVPRNGPTESVSSLSSGEGPGDDEHLGRVVGSSISCLGREESGEGVWGGGNALRP